MNSHQEIFSLSDEDRNLVEKPKNLKELHEEIYIQRRGFFPKIIKVSSQDRIVNENYILPRTLDFLLKSKKRDVEK